MNPDNLVKMANQIGTFFEAMPDRAGALKGVSDHIRRFWAVRMRIALTEHLAAGGADLSAMTREALQAHPVLPQPTPFDPKDLPSPEQRHRLDGASES